MVNLTPTQKQKLIQMMKQGERRRVQAYLTSINKEESRPSRFSRSPRTTGTKSVGEMNWEKYKTQQKAYKKYYGTLSQEKIRELESIKHQEQYKRLKSREAEGERIKEQANYLRQKEKFERTNAGRVGGYIQKGFQAVRPGGFSRMLYGASAIPKQGSGIRQTVSAGSGKGRGRPKGTLDRRYAAYGGVYGWRKFQSAQLRMQKLENQRRLSVTPQQEQQLRMIQQRQMAVRQDPERQTIPNTFGNVELNSIFRDIDSAAGLVD